MMADLKTARRRPRTLLVVALLSVLTLNVSRGTGPAAVQAADGWEFGEYTQYTPPPTRGGVSTSTSTLRLSRTAVQLPHVAPGESVDLIAEYEVSAPAETITVKETRILYFNEQQLAPPKERIVTVRSGPNGSKYSLPVPANAALGFYAVKTTIESEPVVTTRGPSRPAVAEAGRSTFLVQTRAASTPVKTGTLPFKLWTDKKQYKVGETVTVGFEAPRDGYVTIVNVGTSGRIMILYPNAYAPDHAVKAGRAYSVPAPGDPYELKLSGPEGGELVYAVFTTSPIRFVETNFTKSAFTTVNEKAEEFTRDINVAVKTIPLKEQANAALVIDVIR